jgi:secreted trypsin-like serine protease
MAQFCAASLIAPDWALTAAHCVEGRSPATIRVAGQRLVLSAITEPERVAPDRIVLYPFRSPTVSPLFADLALLHLPQPLASTVRLPQGLQYNDGFKTAGVAGWGVTDPLTGSRPDALQSASVTILSRVGCSQLSLPNGVLCATFPGSSQASVCFGDSGGPLAGLTGGQTVSLLGIIGSLPSEGVAGAPLCGVGRAAFFTNVGRYRSWIAHVLRNLDPATSMPEFVRLRARDRGRVIEVRAKWCQTAAVGHRIRVDISVVGARGSGARGEGIRAVVRGRAATICPEAVIRRPDTYKPGRYDVFVKIKDQSTGMATTYSELLRGGVTIRS